MAYIAETSRVSGNARVSDWSKVTDFAQVYGSAWVFGSAWLFGDARAFGNARIVAGYVGDGAEVFEPHHVQTFRDERGVLWTAYRRHDKKPRIMRFSDPVKYRDAPPIVRALAAEVARPTNNEGE